MSGHVLVAAHPDDEVLWLSGAAANARMVLCYGAPLGRPAQGEARRRALAALQWPELTALALAESGTRLAVDWARPVLTPTGIAIADPAGRARYDANFGRLMAALRPLLAGAGAVYTHNPWGEYGHPEHIQVYRAVAGLQRALGFTLWFSNYVSPLTWPLARQFAAAPCWAEKRCVAPDLALARRARAIYRRHGVWTFPAGYRWPAFETYYAQPPAPDVSRWHGLAGETLLDARALRWWRPRRAALRILR